MIRFTPAQFCLTIIIINILARTKNRCNSQWPHSDQVDLHFLFKCETRQCEKIQLVQCVTNSAWLKCETSVLCSVWACSTQCAAHLGQCAKTHWCTSWVWQRLTQLTAATAHRWNGLSYAKCETGCLSAQEAISFEEHELHDAVPRHQNTGLFRNQWHWESSSSLQVIPSTASDLLTSFWRGFDNVSSLLDSHFQHFLVFDTSLV